VLSESADFQYKCTDYYAPEFERSLRWDDPHVGIEWPLADDIPLQLADKDAKGCLWPDADTYDELPVNHTA